MSVYLYILVYLYLSVYLYLFIYLTTHSPSQFNEEKKEITSGKTKATTDSNDVTLKYAKPTSVTVQK